MNDMSVTARLLSFTAAAAIMLAVFDSVVLVSGTLPDVKVARAVQAENRAAAFRSTLLAAAQAASAAR